MSQPKLEQLKRLADALADGQATPQDAALLSQLLKDDPQAQNEYLDYIDVHAQLSWEFRGGDDASGGAKPAEETVISGRCVHPSVDWWRAHPLATMAAAFAALVVVAVAIVGPRVILRKSTSDSAMESKLEHAKPLQQGDTFWQLTQTAGARWESDSQLQAGDRFGTQRLQLDAGLVQLTLDNGVQVVISGPAELELVDPMHAWLHRGRVVFRVPPDAIGYTVETAEANVMDLGTEFGVRSGESIGTDVQVFEGEVVAQVKRVAEASSTLSSSASHSHSRRLQGGQAVRIARGGDGAPEELPFWPDRFVRYLPDPSDPRAPHDAARGRVSPYNTAVHEEIHIVPARPGVRIDGSLDDWDLSGQFSSRCQPPYDTFYHVQGAMMYDDDFLYIGAQVGDPFPMRSTVSPHEERTLYGNGGCLAFRISTDRRMGWPVRGKGRGTDHVRELVAEDYNEKLVFLVLWFYEPEALPCLHVKYGMDQHGRKVNPPGYQGAFRKHDDGWGYTAEYAIPWSLLSAEDAPPRAGDFLGCTWLVHWAGPEGRNWKGQLIDVVNPAETGWNFQNAGTWGRAIYLDQGRR